MSDQLSEVFDQVFKILFLGLSPIFLIVLLASAAASMLQSAIAVHNECLDFAVRFSAFLIGLYFFLPGIITAVIELSRYCYFGG